MRYLNDLPLKSKLLLVTLATCMAALVLACTALFLFQSITFRKGFVAELESLGAIIAHNSAAPLAFADKKSAAEVLGALKVKPHITSASIFDSDGKLFASLGAGSPVAGTSNEKAGAGVTFHQGYARLSLPIRLEDARSGRLELQAFFQDHYRNLLTLYAFVMAAVLAGSLILIVVMSSVLQRIITGPILALAGVARKISEQEDYSARACEAGKDEVGLLTRTFNRMLDQIQSRDTTLRQVNTSLESEIIERKHAEKQLEKLHSELVTASRQAGMADVATGVLHNVGNVLNSVNVSTTLVCDRLRESKVANLGRAVALIRGKNGELVEFLTNDAKGKVLPEYIATVCEHLTTERDVLLQEMTALGQNIEHIKEIVSMQQAYAKVSGITEIVAPADLLEDAVRMNTGAFLRHGVTLVREFHPTPAVAVDRHKVLQILVNLLRNAKYAMDELDPPEKRLVLGIASNGSDRVIISVQDNGVGIPAENLTRIFGHGFTTKKDGHGFGLHSGANAAREIGGQLLVHSDGPGQGATFTLELPVAKETSATTPA